MSRRVMMEYEGQPNESKTRAVKIIAVDIALNPGTAYDMLRIKIS
jgi:hypothetical protein